ncbi:hypothetical protein Bra3105_06585 [Brachybacterium halotolerans subsp. kimchii]|uniref:hypothetical protein n=1 Tax=Brachybacterium halotolerans TaxID=2795215 RepID=UPI001E41BE1F|nr:hypothetical protein [Brachybacterium halotolerans]UEJ83973.1 hypothetical protein Bra3105_06585 [Brachybacterium halotolerans subsp. kimchii]
MSAARAQTLHEHCESCDRLARKAERNAKAWSGGRAQMWTLNRGHVAHGAICTADPGPTPNTEKENER